jgi:hypothetical protein
MVGETGRILAEKTTAGDVGRRDEVEGKKADADRMAVVVDCRDPNHAAGTATGATSAREDKDSNRKLWAAVAIVDKTGAAN